MGPFNSAAHFVSKHYRAALEDHRVIHRVAGNARSCRERSAAPWGSFHGSQTEARGTRKEATRAHAPRTLQSHNTVARYRTIGRPIETESRGLQSRTAICRSAR